MDPGRALARHRVAELLKSTMPAVTKHDPEVRQVVRGVGAEKRRATLASLDDAVASDVLNAPAIASGLDQQAWDVFLQRYREARHPKIMKRVARAQRAIDMLGRAGDAYLQLVLNVVDRTAIKEAEARDAAARKALLAD